MGNVAINFKNTVGRIKPMHAVNNGPMKYDPVEQSRGNCEDFKAAEIPYVRTHDSQYYAAFRNRKSTDITDIKAEYSACFCKAMT